MVRPNNYKHFMIMNLSDLKDMIFNGEPLVKGKALTCFPSWFEKQFMFEVDYDKLLPFDMEVELEKKGANLKRVDHATRSNSQIVDTENRIITASSATRGEFITEEVLKMLSFE